MLRAPALRERRQDIPELSARFLRQACEENHLRRTLSDSAVERFGQYDFPGNVRELKNLIERLVILAPGDVIDADDVTRALPAGLPLDVASGAGLEGTLRETMAGFERQVVLQVLGEQQWRMTAAAERLGLERSHLYKKLKALGIEKPE